MNYFLKSLQFCGWQTKFSFLGVFQALKTIRLLSTCSTDFEFCYKTLLMTNKVRTIISRIHYNSTIINRRLKSVNN